MTASVTVPARLAQRGVAGIRAMVEAGAGYGVAAQACLAGSGVPESALADDAAQVRGGQELVVAHNLVRAVGDVPGLGLDVGGRFRLRTFGVWGFALLSSLTLRNAADVGLRYLDLSYAMAAISLHRNDREVHLVVDASPASAPVRRFLVEREMAAVRTILDTILGEPFVPLRVEVRCPRPRDAARYETAARAPLVFEAARNAIVAETALLDRPLPQADPHTMHVCERECRALLARRVGGRVAAQVQDLLLRGQDTVPGMATAAAELHVSTRTLHRRLAAEGTSYRRLVDEVRHVLAIELLTTAGLGVEQVAMRLGYSDAAAFIRAFRRWTGATPGSYRTHDALTTTRNP